ncbi:non-structural maintenance of chromosomes element 1 homolog isoform X2 [Dendropsophus ebraccatus]|uniref:non-structural maintenance of chromosomes element 1 homolog isoform X2 n=1 Tax=Dendropsophus ebraccatus TaxID=150705 RepID=UPI0038318D45
MAMTESHQRFLQVLMSHGIMEGSAVRKLHKHCCDVHKVQYMHDKLDDFVGIINKHLQPLFMQIRNGTDENDGRQYYSLVNIAENEVTKMAMDFAEHELELFRKTLDLIIDSDNGFASSTNILNLTDQLQTKKIKKKEVEQLLQSFVQEKWLIEGQICDNCGIKIHLTCVEKYFRGQDEPRCPHCADAWSHEIPRLSQTDSQTDSQTPSTSQKHTRRGERRGNSVATSTRSRRS